MRGDVEEDFELTAEEPATQTKLFESKKNYSPVEDFSEDKDEEKFEIEPAPGYETTKSDYEEITEEITEEKIEEVSGKSFDIEFDDSDSQNVYKMISADKVYCATAYLKAVSIDSPEVEPEYLRLAYAVNDPGAKCNYRSNRIYELFGVPENRFDEALMTAAAVRTFMFNVEGYDYDMPVLHDTIKNFPVVAENPVLGDFIYTLTEFKKKYHKGADLYADYRGQNLIDAEKNSGEAFFELDIKEKTKNKRFLETKKIVFARDSDFAELLKYAINNDLNSRELVENYLVETFLKDDRIIDKSNLDEEKMDLFIDENWRKAAEKITHVEKHVKLFGAPRNGLYGNIVKIIDALCRWVSCAKVLSGTSDDEGRIAYKKIRNNNRKD